ncbi:MULTISPECIES: 5'/3'-nucleotidase SurE [Rhizobium]|uniref:5'-nucleotidase SurE n=1 Tax=Rhizobium esperanzae TaxID=1967781 RepID=A0A7W6W555_9HYPH|nr:5'/3'-nucleotidase SurE [Rhizobium sp. CNPSo 3490]MBB4235845.1 5'-nucleotidase [Rhizobium esperanzae]MDK4732004.1 5'/3'-nucleotidase SurE [Rhizobium sp. CNPSo 3490]
MKVLLTNDDGYQSPGVAAARDALIACGLQVLTVAPDGPRSGTSRSASFRKAITMTKAGGDDVNPIYVTNGTPTDCVRVAVLSGLASEVDAVVSGINEGANLGDDATYSSTLGSAIEGALLGFPALAASQQSRDGRFRLVDLTDYDFSCGAQIMAELTRLMIRDRSKLPPRSVLNFNAPALPAGEIKIASLDRRVWDPSRIHSIETENGPGWLLFDTHPERDPIFEHRPGSDSWVLSQGHAALTPLNFEWTLPGARRGFARWTRSAVAELNEALASEQSGKELGS